MFCAVYMTIGRSSGARFEPLARRETERLLVNVDNGRRDYLDHTAEFGLVGITVAIDISAARDAQLHDRERLRRKLPLRAARRPPLGGTKLYVDSRRRQCTLTCAMGRVPATVVNA